ncbi:MAG: hypothetical protein K2W95_30285 [Candidatus Obscuribacterales bacterium]|nr:hypothetical protein [Candidatus Obscuribacterales bacterium]
MANECSTDKGSCHDASAQECSTGGKEQECNLHEKLLCLADEAWKEVLKEKIKAEIEKSAGEKLTKLAKVVAEANGRRWQFMIQGKKACDDYKNHVRSLLAE